MRFFFGCVCVVGGWGGGGCEGGMLNLFFSMLIVRATCFFVFIFFCWSSLNFMCWLNLYNISVICCSLCVVNSVWRVVVI